jgi:hypothetical protein
MTVNRDQRQEQENNIQFYVCQISVGVLLVNLQLNFRPINITGTTAHQNNQ